MTIPQRAHLRKLRLEVLHLRVAIEERGYLVATRSAHGRVEAVGYFCMDYQADRVCSGTSEVDALQGLWTAVSGSTEPPRYAG